MGHFLKNDGDEQGFQDFFGPAKPPVNASIYLYFNDLWIKSGIIPLLFNGVECKNPLFLVLRTDMGPGTDVC